jgi:hypothetical protein
MQSKLHQGGPWRYGIKRGQGLFMGRDGNSFGMRSEAGLGQCVTKLKETILLTDGAGATETATGAIPAGAQVLAVVGIVTDAITGVTTNFDVGDGVDANRWADAVLLAEDSSWGQSDATADPAGTWAATARDVVLTADAGTFTAGEVRIEVYYIDATAPTQ